MAIKEFIISLSRTYSPRQFHSIKVDVTEVHDVERDADEEQREAFQALSKKVDKIARRELKKFNDLLEEE